MLKTEPGETKVLKLPVAGVRHGSVRTENFLSKTVMLYRRRRYFRTHLYAILGQFWTIFPYFWTPLWKKQ